MEEETKQIYKQLSHSQKLKALSQKKEWEDFESEIKQVIEELNSVKEIKENHEVEVRARQLAIILLEGLIDCVKGAGDDMEFLENQLKKIDKNKGRPSSRDKEEKK